MFGEINSQKVTFLNQCFVFFLPFFYEVQFLPEVVQWTDLPISEEQLTASLSKFKDCGGQPSLCRFAVVKQYFHFLIMELLEDGTMAQGLELWHPTEKVAGSPFGLGSGWSVHVLMLLGVFAGHTSFLPNTKTMHVRLIGNFNSSIIVCERETVQDVPCLKHRDRWRWIPAPCVQERNSW